LVREKARAAPCLSLRRRRCIPKRRATPWGHRPGNALGPKAGPGNALGPKAGEAAILELDGSFGEGGGQILRTSLALSLLTGKAFHLRHVRAGRSRPGLQPQHLRSVEAAAEVGQGQTRGASRGSTDLVFEPGQVQAGTYRFDIGTAGSTGLLLHTIYLPLALRGQGPSELSLIGGTHTETSPCFHFLDLTWRRYLALLGLQLSVRMQRPGFYPRGGGLVEVFLQPCSRLEGITFKQRGEAHLRGFSAVAGLDRSIAQRQARRLRKRLQELGHRIEVEEQTWSGGPGTVVGVEVEAGQVPAFFFALGARGKPAEKVADEAVAQVRAFLEVAGAPIDPHSADQILLPLVLAEGPSEFQTTEVTRHLTTNITMIRHFLDRTITCDGEQGGPGVVRID
jgi:RNA 3'-phosphate cyclase